MPIKIGTVEVGSILRGSTVINKIYRGTTIIYELTPAEVWTKEFLMSILPDADGATANPSNNGIASITSGIMNVITTGIQYQGYRFDIGNLSTTTTKRWETLVKVNSQGGSVSIPSQGIEVSDGVRTALVMFETNKITLFTGSTPTLLHTIDMTAGFVKVKGEMNNVSGFDLYVEDVLIINIPYTSLFVNAANQLAFCDNAGSGYNSDVDWDYLKWNLNV